LAKRRPATLVGLDLGTSTTTVVIAEVSNGSPRVIGIGESLTAGLQKGFITDIKSAAASIRRALDRSEEMAGVKVSSAYVGFNSACISIRNCRVAFNGNHKGSGKQFSGAAVSGVPEGEKLLVVIPSRDILKILKPGEEVEARAVFSKARAIEDIIESARLAGLTVLDVIYSPLAAAEALLSPIEKEFGTLLVDIGSAATTVSIFDRDLIRETAVLAIGGEHLAGDLAVGLRISLAQAGEVLKRYKPSEEGYIEIKDEEGSRRVPNVFIRSIIEARVKEILELIAKMVENFDYPGQLPGGAVLYGGVSQLEGLASLAEKSLGLAVRIGIPQNAGQELRPHYANAFGLVKYGCARAYGRGRSSGSIRRPRISLMGQVVNWLQDKLKDNRQHIFYN